MCNKNKLDLIMVCQYQRTKVQLMREFSYLFLITLESVIQAHSSYRCRTHLHKALNFLAAYHFKTFRGAHSLLTAVKVEPYMLSHIKRPLQGKIFSFELHSVNFPDFESSVIFLISRTVLILQEFKFVFEFRIC